MSARQPASPPDHRATTRAEGSALVAVMFVLALLMSLGITLLFVASTDVRMNQAGVRAKRVFYSAEAGLEDARGALRAANLSSVDPNSFDDELAKAAGVDGVLDFDPLLLRPVYDAAGRPIGFTGFDDDDPVRPFTTFSDGAYAAFLTNDPQDGTGSLVDTNDRVMVTAIGVGPSRSVEIVQAVLERISLPPFDAAITLLGSAPVFDGGNSNARTYTGNDCAGTSGYAGVPGSWVPTVGVLGPSAVAGAQAGVRKPASYTAGPYTGTATVRDTTPTMDPSWTDCAFLAELAQAVRSRADWVCTPSTPCSHWSSTTLSTITFADGNLDLGPVTGRGLLFVTGRLTVQGNSTWEGIVLVIGRGEFERGGGGNGHTWGATLVANIAGPDRVLGTADDCTGGVGGIADASYVVSGSGVHHVAFCSDAVTRTNYGFPLSIVDFRQW